MIGLGAPARHAPHAHDLHERDYHLNRDLASGTPERGSRGFSHGENLGCG